MYKSDLKNPPESVLKTREYFNENADRIEYTCTLLYDEKSKELFRKSIEFKKTHDFKSFPPSDGGKTQCFVKDLVHLNDHETFVNCGGYHGETARQFQKLTNMKYNKIVVFEADVDSIEIIKRDTENIVLIPYGGWSEDTTISFANNSNSTSKLIDTDSMIDHVEKVISINTKAIDSVKDCEEATFIEIDIEGSEYNALLGARKTIERNIPILTISIYHSDEDMLRLIELIHSWNLPYKYYIRHHHDYKINETTLYCIPPDKQVAR